MTTPPRHYALHGTYHGIWNWDSAFHAVAVSHWDGKLAGEQFEILFSKQFAQWRAPRRHLAKRNYGHKLYQAAGDGLGGGRRFYIWLPPLCYSYSIIAGGEKFL